jgi:hypothetical protein
MADPVPIFAYWDDADVTKIASTIEEWRTRFPQFNVLGDKHIVPLVGRYFPEYIESYSAIRIPAAKADVARLLALYEWGGLYVDCHCGIKDQDALRHLIGKLNEFEAIFLDRRLEMGPRPPGEHLLINAILLGRQKSLLFLMIAREALANLDRQRRIEREKGFVPYDIWCLSGPGLVNAVVFQPGTGNREIRAELVGRVLIIPEEAAPIVRDRHRGYTQSVPGSEWSVRQNTEPLFAALSKENSPRIGC